MAHEQAVERSAEPSVATYGSMVTGRAVNDVAVDWDRFVAPIRTIRDVEVRWEELAVAGPGGSPA